MTNPIAIAVKGKGVFNVVRRGVTLAARYGLTPTRFERALAQFVQTLDRFGCRATFPITLAALQRHPQAIQHYQAQGIEFAVHGYRHIDHSQLGRAEQAVDLARCRKVLEQTDIQAAGFRGPYLRRNLDTLAALREQGFVYDATQAMDWLMPTGMATEAYRRAVQFYRAFSARDYASVPDLQDGLVSIPYSLPDDEALVERLALRAPDEMSQLWWSVLQQTYTLGELFTVGLHPERLPHCQQALADTLAEARARTPSVWIARLDEIAAWWQARTSTTVILADEGERMKVSIAGPAGVTILARGVELDVPAIPWADGYCQVHSTDFVVTARPKPVIGLSPTISPQLASFLQQQGYVTLVSQEAGDFAYYMAETEFTAEQGRAVLAHIEGTARSLIRLGRWPNGAKSALAVTGDIDALTVWDYGWRAFGR